LLRSLPSPPRRVNIIHAQVRERLIVAYYRYKNMGNENFMEVKNLCGGTGFKMPSPSDKNKEPVCNFL
jgi:hypothetical protein